MEEAVQQLEREFAAWLGVAGAVAAGFGRAAMVLALRALDVAGGEVLVPNFICAQVPEAARRAGARPAFYPVQRDLTVAAEQLETRLTPRTRAVIAVHYFGRRSSEISRIAAICRERRIPLIEDCALALGAFGRSASLTGDAAVFSFTKCAWCYGGGIIATSQPGLLERLWLSRKGNFRPASLLALRYGLLRRADFASNRPSLAQAAEFAGRWLERMSGRGRTDFYEVGRFDSTLPGFAARRARSVLAQLPKATAARRRIWEDLISAIREPGCVLRRPRFEPEDATSYVLLVCPLGEAESWRERAAREGVTLRRTWPAYQDRAPEQNSAELEWLAERLLLLEVHPGQTPAEVKQIGDTINRLARAQGETSTGGMGSVEGGGGLRKTP